jgi:hypothetical protein
MFFSCIGYWFFYFYKHLIYWFDFKNTRNWRKFYRKTKYNFPCNWKDHDHAWYRTYTIKKAYKESNCGYQCISKHDLDYNSYKAITKHDCHIFERRKFRNDFFFHISICINIQLFYIANKDLVCLQELYEWYWIYIFRCSLKTKQGW